MFTDEPAVLTWMIALAPRPREPQRRHWWRDLVTDAWFAADQAWQLEAEAASVGYATELAEFAALKPRPRLRDFMVHLSTGAVAPERALS